MIAARSLPLSLLLLLLSLAALSGRPARAENVGQLASAFDKDDPFDAHFRLLYNHRLRRGAINRQLTGRDGSQTTVERVKELRFNETTDTINLRAEIGIWRDLQVHVELPIIVQNSRQLSFARNGGSSCGSPIWTWCVTPRNSTLVRDGFIDASRMAVDQRIVAGPDGAPGGRLLPDRSGVDQIYIGLTWAPVNQLRDPTKPTWAIGFEARPSIGKIMKYNPQDAEANTGVSKGLHDMHFWTAIARRFPFIDTWFGFHYLLPLARPGSLFEETRFDGSGQQRAGPRHRGWFEGGVEFVPWQQPERNNRVAIELSGQIEGVFEGRGYSPLWELLAGQPVLVGQCLDDSTPGQSWDNGTYCRTAGEQIPYVGLTRIEDHLNFYGTLAVSIELSKHFFGRIGVSFGHESRHELTIADAGHVECDVNNPNSDACQGRLTPTDPRQANPMYRPTIDAPGRRFELSETTVFDFFISAMGRF